MREFRANKEQLEGKIGMTIPPQVEICQFMTALWWKPEVQERFENLAAQKPSRTVQLT